MTQETMREIWRDIWRHWLWERSGAIVTVWNPRGLALVLPSHNKPMTHIWQVCSGSSYKKKSKVANRVWTQDSNYWSIRGLRQRWSRAQVHYKSTYVSMYVYIMMMTVDKFVFASSNGNSFYLTIWRKVQFKSTKNSERAWSSEPRTWEYGLERVGS